MPICTANFFAGLSHHFSEGLHHLLVATEEVWRRPLQSLDHWPLDKNRSNSALVKSRWRRERHGFRRPLLHNLCIVGTETPPRYWRASSSLNAPRIGAGLCAVANGLWTDANDSTSSGITRLLQSDFFLRCNRPANPTKKTTRLLPCRSGVRDFGAHPITLCSPLHRQAGTAMGLPRKPLCEDTIEPLRRFG